MWDDGKHISLNVISYTVNSCLGDTPLLWMLATTGLKIKKILRSPFGDQLEKYSRQMQIFSRQFV